MLLKIKINEHALKNLLKIERRPQSGGHTFIGKHHPQGTPTAKRSNIISKSATPSESYVNDAVSAIKV
jgi:hypothetical protein